MIAANLNLIRVCIAIAMGLGFTAWMPAGNGTGGSIMRECGCTMCAGQPSCCAVPQDPAPVHPVAPAQRDSSEGQPLTLADRPVLMAPIPDVAMVFPDRESAPRAMAARHSFQSLRCMWMV